MIVIVETFHIISHPIKFWVLKSYFLKIKTKFEKTCDIQRKEKESKRPYGLFLTWKVKEGDIIKLSYPIFGINKD